LLLLVKYVPHISTHSKGLLQTEVEVVCPEMALKNLPQRRLMASVAMVPMVMGA